MRKLRIKVISNFLQAVQEVMDSLATFGGRIVEHLDERHPRVAGPPAEGEVGWSYEAVFDHLRRDLQSMYERLSAAKDQHVRMLVRIDVLRSQSQGLAKRLYKAQVTVRRILGAAFDPGRSFQVAAASGETPRGFTELEEQAGQTVKILRQPEVEMGPIEVDGVEIDLGDMADGLENRLEEFRQVQKSRRRARKALAETKVVKDQAIDYCKGLLPGVSQTLEGYFRIAGEPELADRIRTSTSKATRRQREDEPETSEPASPISETSEASETSEMTETSETTV